MYNSCTANDYFNSMFKVLSMVGGDLRVLVLRRESCNIERAP